MAASSSALKSVLAVEAAAPPARCRSRGGKQARGHEQSGGDWRPKLSSVAGQETTSFRFRVCDCWRRSG